MSIYDVVAQIPEPYLSALSITILIACALFYLYGHYAFGDCSESINKLIDDDLTNPRQVLTLLNRILINVSVKALINKAKSQRNALSIPEIFHFEFVGSEQEVEEYNRLERAFSRAVSFLDSSELSYSQAKQILFSVLPVSSAFGFETFRKSLSLGIFASFVTKSYDFLFHCAKLKTIMHTESLSQYHYYLSGDESEFISEAEKHLNQTFEQYLYSDTP